MRKWPFLLIAAFSFCVSVKSVGGEAFAERSQKGLTVIELALHKAKGTELWDSEDAHLFEIALLTGPIGRFRNKTLAGGIGPVGSLDVMAAKMWKRLEGSKDPDIQAMVLSYMPLTAVDKSQEKALSAFHKSPHPRVRAAALVLLTRSTAFRRQKAYADFVEKALEWLASEKAKVDLRYAIRHLCYWINNGTVVRTALSEMTPRQRQRILDRLAEYLASRNTVTRQRAAKALMATRLPAAYSVLLDRAEQTRGVELLGILLMETEQLPIEYWRLPAGMRLLRRSMIEGKDALAASAEKKYKEAFKKSGQASVVQRQLLMLKLLRLQVSGPSLRARTIAQLNEARNEVVRALDACPHLPLFSQAEVEGLKKEGLSEKIAKKLPLMSAAKLIQGKSTTRSKKDKMPSSQKELEEVDK
jgi:hypothetical protein